jgi:hypothetical protein
MTPYAIAVALFAAFVVSGVLGRAVPLWVVVVAGLAVGAAVFFFVDRIPAPARAWMDTTDLTRHREPLLGVHAHRWYPGVPCQRLWWLAQVPLKPWLIVAAGRTVAAAWGVV